MLFFREGQNRAQLGDAVAEIVYLASNRRRFGQRWNCEVVFRLAVHASN